MMREREAEHIRRRSVARYHRGQHSFHGTKGNDHVAELRYEPDRSLSIAPDVVDPKRPGNRKPKIVASDKLKRLAAGTTDQESTYDDSDREDEDTGRKKKKKRKR